MDDPSLSRSNSHTLPSMQIQALGTSESRSHSRSSPFDLPSQGPPPMAIPNARLIVPPPLPPPRYGFDLADGRGDLAWEFQNNQLNSGQNSFRSDKIQSSSLFGGYHHSPSKVKPTEGIISRDVRLKPHDDEGYSSIPRSPNMSVTSFPSHLPSFPFHSWSSKRSRSSIVQFYNSARIRSFCIS